ncbi:CubicO group peptidase (beta-lactamase class C family) [Prauserella shujinwangii]|uniref:CubicO group peptidase (Beta-lactamase class C family) n=1 Tax=Prauserella shujinwangii TaxID=1453103 RepID=A0A2T0LYR2_9PSEU|nr:serine hydrolase domain-containing protein [Prauserella shujinwangii]PRX49258.1 CubicO group peptidase (beta-lactamase class C family) [Prauserella shujinwangii]
MTVPLGGRVAAGFEPVREAFAGLLASGAETGGALTVLLDGRPVVALHGGWTDHARTAVWRPDTLVNVFSVGKPVAALCLLTLVERGLVALDDPVSRHWPGFTGEGVSVRHVLSHTAGLPAFPVERPARAFADWGLLTGDLAAATPEWAPGTAAAEHALTYGHLVGELVRRISGRTPGAFLAAEIAGPLGLDLGFGLPARARTRCADPEFRDPGWAREVIGRPGSLRAAALGNPAGWLDPAVLGTSWWRRAEVPAVNLHASASGLAGLYAALLGGRLLGAELTDEAVRTQYEGHDLLLDRPVRWTLGMQLDDDGTWGMGGIGGSVGYADPARGYTLGYVTRRLAGFERVDTLVEALHPCL